MLCLDVYFPWLMVHAGDKIQPPLTPKNFEDYADAHSDTIRTAVRVSARFQTIESNRSYFMS